VRRRDFITLVGGAAVGWPLAARAQQERQRLVAVLMAWASDDPAGQSRFAALLTTLQQLGWIEGRNLKIEVRWFAGDVKRENDYAAEAVSLAPDAIVAAGNPVTAELLRLTRSIPIVFAGASDPVGSGFAASLAKPGSNITGFTNFEPAMASKWLDILKEVAPRISQVAVLLHPETAAQVAMWRAVEAAAPSVGVKVIAAGVHDRAEIEGAITALAAQMDGGLMILPHPVNLANRDLIFDLAVRHRLPTVCPLRYYALSGGLVTYGIDQIEQWQGAGKYVDRILKGEKPADLPVQQPTKFELIVNLKTARAIGLAIPESFLQRADEIIE
jgi:putative ABC transport system substrate-binding protein